MTGINKKQEQITVGTVANKTKNISTQIQQKNKRNSERMDE